MSVNDVAVVMQPNAQHLGFNPSIATSRLTFQHFSAPDVVTALVAPHNSDARQRVGHDNWPPTLLFDISYGCAALHTWGVPQFVELARQRTKHIYYEDNDDDGENDDGGEGDDGSDDGGDGGDGGHSDDGGDGEPDVQPMSERASRGAAREKRKSEPAWRPTPRKKRKREMDSQTPDFADIILALWTHNARKGQRQAREAKAEETQEKVRTWLDSTKT